MREQKDLYNDFLSVFDRYKNFLSFLEEILLWEEYTKSIIVYLLIHFTFWKLIYFPYSYLFLIAIIFLVYFLYELFASIFKFSLFSVRSAPPRILNSNKMALYASRVFYFIFSISNKLVKFRNVTPIGFYIFAMSSGFSFIQLSYYINGIFISYSLLNALLTIPVIRFHQIHLTLWRYIKPYIDSLEAEFDKHQLEEPGAAEKQETQIASEIIFNGVPLSGKNLDEFKDWVDKISFGNFDIISNFSETDPENFDNTNDFMNKSRVKNDETLTIITNDVMKEKDADDLSFWIDRFMEGRENESFDENFIIDGSNLRGKGTAWLENSTEDDSELEMDEVMFPNLK